MELEQDYNLHANSIAEANGANCQTTLREAMQEKEDI